MPGEELKEDEALRGIFDEEKDLQLIRELTELAKFPAMNVEPGHGTSGRRTSQKKNK